ncbi:MULTISPECIES: class I SAM-dependent methyltransferase [Streptomyces]|uniref:class I SAM-dependent methyltransferase n=1 Tax=Streptomyces TaxID=1883 RepID=UPI0004BD24FB|nr:MULTISPECIES: class I SAM-dependent methyltransferase [Streptomyces]KJY19128.1 methyltransferase [Streptomyces sp. NRRL S-104]KOU30304.1 methyltransferase [Streptomyces sp. WM6373]KOU63622.1 methyltransferase [Streptomyces sp. IGB124]KOU70866.1 methyltransferase [Streptomyces sp. XY66]KOU97597.1 methyltransferase [Streptomyces sp. XY58]
MSEEHDTGAWFADQAFWRDFYPHLFSAERAAQAVRIVERSPLFRFPSGARVLDLCCGPGLFTVPLARAGHEVTGVDLSAPLLERARTSSRDAGVDVRFVEADMLAFAEPEAFDAAVNMFTSFGYLDRHEDNVQVLRNLHTSLAPGGTLLVDVVGKEILARRDERVSLSELDGKVLVQRDTVLDDWSRLRSDWYSIEGSRAATGSMTLHLYSAAELRDMLRSAGFAGVRFHGDYEGGPYDHRAERLIAVATKGVDARGN